MRAGKINIVAILILVALVIGALFLHTFGPYYWDAINMKEVVRNSALTYQDRGKEKGLERLTQELYQRDIPDYIVEDDCRLENRGEIFTVRCAWTVSQDWPFTSIAREMSFDVEAKRGPSGFID
jgi:hypothetical protein